MSTRIGNQPRAGCLCCQRVALCSNPNPAHPALRTPALQILPRAGSGVFSVNPLFLRPGPRALPGDGHCCGFGRFSRGRWRLRHGLGGRRAAFAALTIRANRYRPVPVCARERDRGWAMARAALPGGVGAWCCGWCPGIPAGGWFGGLWGFWLEIGWVLAGLRVGFGGGFWVGAKSAAW